MVLQEVLQGARGERDFLRLQEYLETQIFRQPLDPIDSYTAAARIYADCRSRGITVRSAIDCLIAQIALEHDLVLLHDDRDFEQIRKVIPKLNTDYP